MSETSKTAPRSRSASAPISVLLRAFEVLGAFDQGPQDQLSLSEIARRTGLPKTTVFRLLASLEQIGAVERGDLHYQLGLRLFELGERVPLKRDLREAALPFMGDLYEVTHETVHLAVLEGTDVVYIERILGHRTRPRPLSSVGGRLPAYCTGVGKALLAFTPKAASSVVSKGTLAARTPYTIVNPKLLLEELRTVRSLGLAFDRDENSVGVHCVAAPIIVRGVAVAAISVAGRPDRISIERVGSAVRTASLGLQRQLMTSPRFTPRNTSLTIYD